MGKRAAPHLVVVDGQGASAQAPTDDALMALVASGETRALEVLARRHLHRVASFCTRFVGNRGEGEELAQEVFLALWKQRAHYRPRQQFTEFLFTLAVNRCRNHQRWWRRWARGRERLQAMPSEASSASALDDLLRAERKRWLETSLTKLSPLLREALLLRFELGLDYREIAASCGCSEGSARARVFRAVEQLRAAHAEVSR